MCMVRLGWWKQFLSFSRSLKDTLVCAMCVRNCHNLFYYYFWYDLAEFVASYRTTATIIVHSIVTSCGRQTTRIDVEMVNSGGLIKPKIEFLIWGKKNQNVNCSLRLHPSLIRSVTRDVPHLKLKEIHYIFVTWTAITFAFCVPAKPLRIIYLLYTNTLCFFIIFICFFEELTFSIIWFFTVRDRSRSAEPNTMKWNHMKFKWNWFCALLVDEFYFFPVIFGWWTLNTGE